MSTAATAPAQRPTLILVYVLPVLLLPFLAQADLPRPSGPLASFLIDFAVRIFAPAIALWLLARNLNLLPRHYGLAWSLGDFTRGQFIAATFLCFIGYMGYVVAFNVAQFWLFEFPSKSVSDLEVLQRSSLIVLVYFAATAAFFEEVLYRGVLGAMFLSRPSTTATRLAYVLFSTLLFAAVHAQYGVANTIACVYVGIFTAVFYIWARNLWMLIAAHFATDLIVGIWAARHAAL